MKQHITLKQLNELSGKGMRKLRRWCKAEEGALPFLLSIGQMIEFLYDNRSDKRRKKLCCQLLKFIDQYYDCYVDIYPEKMCDQLWEDVKWALEI